MTAWLAQFLFRRRVLVISVTIIALTVCGFLGSSVASELTSGGFEDPNAESSAAAEVLEREFGQGSSNLHLLVTAPAGVDDPSVTQTGRTLTEELAGEAGVIDVRSYWSQRAPPLAAADGTEALILGRIVGDEDQVATRVEQLVTAYTRSNDQINVTVGGSAAITGQLRETITADYIRAEKIAFPILLVMLVLVFGSVGAALLPLAVGALTIVGTFAILQLLTGVTDVSVYALNLTTGLGLGLAIDYSLFMVSRFREELAAGLSVDEAVARTVRTAGKTVAFSGILVAISLAALLIFPQVFMRSFAYAGLTVVGVAMVGALIVLPALLAILGHRVNAFRIWHRNPTSAGESRWHRITVAVMRRPIPVATGVVAVLLLLGAPFLNVQFGGVDSRVLPADNPARIVSEKVRANFAGNESAVVTVVVPDHGDPAASSAKITTYARELSLVAGVARVDAATGSYLGGQRIAANPASANHLSAEGTWLSVVPAVEPISPAATTLVADLRAIDPPFDGVLIGGPSAVFVDSQQSLLGLLPVAIGIIATVTFILLFVMFGSLFVPIKAILLNVLSLTAMYGAMVWVFQDGNLSGLLGFTATGTLDTSIPILMFCLAFGVSMDYEVFLLSRIKEEYDRAGDNTAAVAMGLARTGEIVTTAAVLLATVLVIFATSGVTLIKLFGVGLALALVMDATLIRLCLVPAVMKLADQANWWLPHPLRRFHQRFKISEWETEYPIAATRDVTPSTMQRRLNHGVWDKREAMGIVGEFAVEHLNSPDAVAVLDETGPGKNGKYTAGAKRQYVGCAEQVTNAVDIVYCTYASPHGHAHVGYRLYLPKDWAGNPERCIRAGVGEDVVFQTKPQLAVDLLSDLDNAGVLPPWVASTEEYGRDTELRSFCEDRTVGYVLGVPYSFTVELNSHRKTRANQALKLVRAKAWNRVSRGPWSTGKRTYAWAWIATTSPQHSLLVRRSLTDSTDRAYFYCYVPEGRTVTLGTLVRVAGMRCPVEEGSHTTQTHPLIRTPATLAICARTTVAMREATDTVWSSVSGSSPG